MTEHTGCVIVGGGPAGMVAGLLLARAGVEVTVLEKHADFLRDFRGDTVHPSTLTLLDQLGLGEKFNALPHTEVQMVGFPVDGGGVMKIADLSRLKVPHPYVAMVPQWDFLDLLAEAAQKEPTFTLRLETEMTGLLRADRRVSGVRYCTAGGTEGTLEADLVIAADGRWSLARESAGLEPHEYDTPFDAWWFRISRHENEPGGMLVPRIHNRRFAIPLPRKGYHQIAYLAPKGEDLRAAGIESFRESVADLCPEFADRTHELKSMDDVKFLDVRLNRLHRWHVDGLLCIGDAAHAMSPVGGVGINLAVQDAVGAATLLAESLLHGQPTPKELAAVRSRRLLPTIAVQTLQRLLHREVMRPVMAGERNQPPPAMVRLFTLFPRLSAIPAHLLGVGFRPEMAPPFARRPMEPAGR
ncbi:2-polyprenyl-6-methoxyphenol hydroxylase-like FAD-dependent oxidoreductase [Amycolatopsis sulphurea]|uniref:2-polyprenyl-6-methoxyphenol hydroxylase-like FAD-dependent oxidoreductase n=1 Tax=Amycolatopsis sulphurea TaxID=76022 RepID=A0A2A9F8U5_9PSEU|nr:FAD-dependent oxidoreductase [Amycolatopsis sulphurea]PFG46839.1 2-polyprenyl-6-methoxyphenol hydroxylase-like FAD-dependent oxidoreductase [Amycolatopsis sulphurea]